MSEIALDTLERSVTAETARAGAPKYLQVFDAFEKGIRSGRFKPGQRVPTEAALSARLPVSLGTIQKALAKLAEQGLVVRNRKVGTFIADRRWQVTETFVYRIRDPRSGELQLPFVHVLAVEADRSPGPWREALGVKRCVRVDRLVWVEREQPAFTSVYLAYEHGKGLLDIPLAQLHGSSMHRFMSEQFKLPTLRVEHRFQCQALVPEACRHLLLPRGTVGILWDAKDFSLQERPTLFQRLQLPPGHQPIELIERFQDGVPIAAAMVA